MLTLLYNNLKGNKQHIYKNTLTDPKEELTLFSINLNVSYGRVKHKHSREIN